MTKHERNVREREIEAAERRGAERERERLTDKARKMAKDYSIPLIEVPALAVLYLSDRALTGADIKRAGEIWAELSEEMG